MKTHQLTTEQLAQELLNRVNDRLFDPEPQYDMFLDQVSRAHMEQLYGVLKNCYAEYLTQALSKV